MDEILVHVFANRTRSGNKKDFKIIGSHFRDNKQKK